MAKVRAEAPDRTESFFSIASNDFHNGQVSDAALDLDADAAVAAAAAAVAASEVGDDSENIKEKSWGRSLLYQSIEMDNNGQQTLLCNY